MPHSIHTSARTDTYIQTGCTQDENIHSKVILIQMTMHYRHDTHTKCLNVRCMLVFSQGLATPSDQDATRSQDENPTATNELKEKHWMDTIFPTGL